MRRAAAAHGRALDLRRGRIELAHGAGGLATAQLITELFARRFDAGDNVWLRQGNDCAVLPPANARMAMSCDCHVVTPLFFPGGDIGSLAINGTVNDLAMGGATPLYLSAGFILEEGLELSVLDRVVQSMAAAAKLAGVHIVAGDTKVVERGKADGLYITTAGVGVLSAGIDLDGANARPGDLVLVSGSMGDHGACILSQRQDLGFEGTIESDCAPLTSLAQLMLGRCPQVRLLRDPTRGGLANTLNEVCQQSGVGMRIEEGAIPIAPQVRAACEIFGLDALYLANEGKLVAVCPAPEGPALVGAMREHPLGREAAIIGQVIEQKHGFVRLATTIGGERLLDWLHGEMLPRIC